MILNWLGVGWDKLLRLQEVLGVDLASLAFEDGHFEDREFQSKLDEDVKELINEFELERKCVGKYILRLLHGPGKEDGMVDIENFDKDWSNYVRGKLKYKSMMRVDYDGFIQLMRGRRKWQLTGDIYSHILQEMPRVIAEIWREKKLKTRFSMNELGMLHAYQYENRARRIFMERIEAWIPDEDEMLLKVMKKMVSETENRKGDKIEGNYDGCPEVLITQDGFLLPSPPDQPVMKTMFTEMKTGEAVNPVFTDTHCFK